MAPQSPELNRGVWRILEEQIRDWAEYYGTLQVITGPVLKGSRKYIGESRVLVPKAFYKIVSRQTATGTYAIGFLFPNDMEDYGEVVDYIVPIDDIEEVVDYNFLTQLAAEEEFNLEANRNQVDWRFN